MGNLIDKLPPFYARSPEMVNLQQMQQTLIDELWSNRASLAAQLCIDTATWGLATWEKALGLSSGAAMELAQRRARIKTKLRGTGVTTAAVIEQVASTFSGGVVEVIELAPQYTVKIKFVGTVGKPPDMDSLTRSLREIMPAHLRLEYEYIYNIWADVAPLTWAQLAAHTWEGVGKDELIADN